MSLLILRYFWTATVLTFLKKWLTVAQGKRYSKWYLNMEKLKHKADLKVTERIIFEITSHLH